MKNPALAVAMARSKVLGRAWIAAQPFEGSLARTNSGRIHEQ
jgi:hypothetical protein